MSHNSYTQMTDAQLVQQYVSMADMKCMEELYNRYQRKVFGIAYHVLRDKEESVDILLAVFEKVMHELAKTEVRDFGGWLYMLTRNACLMRLRGEKRRAAREKLYAASLPHEEEIEPELFHDKNQALKRALNALSETQRTCVELFYFQHKSYKEVADEMGIDTESVRSQLQNGKRNLKNLMASWR